MQYTSKHTTYQRARNYALSIAEIKEFSPEYLECFIIGFMQGYDEGYDEGRAEERESLNVHNILRMRSKGYDDETIADLLELDTEYVKKH